MSRIRIGTRGSKLALQQAALVQEAFARADSRIETELVVLQTKGDRIQDRPISALGEKGAFASELERALLDGRIDLAVHSAKDLPMQPVQGLTVAAVLPRADARDVLVVFKDARLPIPRQNVQEVLQGEPCEKRVQEDVRRAFCIGSGSKRRQTLAGLFWENVVFEEIRGNVDTRLRKLREGSCDGILLAKAGLDRLGIDQDRHEEFDFYPLVPELFLPAACQGIIAVEAVQGSLSAAACREITDAKTELCYLVEREVLAHLAADCSESAAAWCRPVKTGTDLPKELVLDVMYADRRAQFICPAEVEEGRRMARQAAQTVKEQGRQ